MLVPRGGPASHATRNPAAVWLSTLQFLTAPGRPAARDILELYFLCQITTDPQSFYSHHKY